VEIGHQTQRGTYQGNPVPPETRATMVLGVDEANWRMAGIHLSFIAGTPGAPPIPGRPAAEQ